LGIIENDNIFVSNQILIMVIRFNNDYLEALYEGNQKGKPKYNNEVILKFKKRSLNFEPLVGNYKGYYSVRVDLKYRLILSLEKGEIEIQEVIVIEDLTNHYK
jgi:plasmid maintenance system killer protein